MPFTAIGADIALKRNPGTGRFDFDWDSTQNPKYDDSNTHRIASLILEHRGSPGNPGWVWDTTGKRGSLLYTLKNVRKATPSQAEAFVLDAMQKAVADGFITAPQVKARKSELTTTRLALDITWVNANKSPGTIRIGIGT